jgi:hypothetical protein
MVWGGLSWLLQVGQYHTVWLLPHNVPSDGSNPQWPYGLVRAIALTSHLTPRDALDVGEVAAINCEQILCLYGMPEVTPTPLIARQYTSARSSFQDHRWCRHPAVLPSTKGFPRFSQFERVARLNALVLSHFGKTGLRCHRRVIERKAAVTLTTRSCQAKAQMLNGLARALSAGTKFALERRQSGTTARLAGEMI